MGGQLGYLYIVGPISMEEGNTMSLPEIPFIGFLIMILMAAGSMIIVAILQKMPAPVRYVTSNLKPYTKKIEKSIDDTSGKSYRSEYPGQFSSKSGKMFYSKGENTDDLNWGGLKPVPEQASFKLGSIQRQVLQLPKSGVLFFLFLMSLALGLVALTERGPFIFLFPIAFVIAFGIAILTGNDLVKHAVLLAFVINWIAYVPAYLLQTEKFYDLTGTITYLTVIWTTYVLSSSKLSSIPVGNLILVLLIFYHSRCN